MASESKDGSTRERLVAAQAEVTRLRNAIKARRAELQDADVSEVLGETKKKELFASPTHRRLLEGHHQRVHAMHWAGDSTHLLSASQDGKLIVWNADSKLKVESIPLLSQWVLTCGG